MSDQTYVQFVVLFTSQKLKKSKTWQDGVLKFYDFNKKMVLMDEKGYNIDRKFQKGKRPPQVGDEIEFDGHLVTVENVSEEKEDVSLSMVTTCYLYTPRRGDHSIDQWTQEIGVEPTPNFQDIRRRHARKSAVNKLKAKWKPPAMMETPSAGHIKDERKETNLEDYPCEEREVAASMQDGLTIQEPVKIKREDQIMATFEHEISDARKGLAHSTLQSAVLSDQKNKSDKRNAGILLNFGHEDSKRNLQSKKQEQSSPLNSIHNTSMHTESCHEDNQISAPSTIPLIQQPYKKPTVTLSPQPSPSSVDIALNKALDSTNQEMDGVETDLGALNMEEVIVNNIESNNDVTAGFDSTLVPVHIHEARAANIQAVTPNRNSRNIPNNSSEDLKPNDIATDLRKPHTTNSVSLGETFESSGRKRPSTSIGNEEAPVVKRRIMVGLSKSKKASAAPKSSDSMAASENSISKSSFIKASEIQNMPLTTLANTDYARANSSNTNGPSPKLLSTASNRTISSTVHARSNVPVIPMISSTSKGFSVPSIITFPNASKLAQAAKTKKENHRKLMVPTRFKAASHYMETFTKLIQEHLQVLLQTYSIYFHSQSKDWCEVQSPLQFARSRGIGLHMEASLAGSSRYISGELDYCLTISNQQHRSKYGKDDIWVISKSLRFEPSGTFLARSTFYGPVGGSFVEIQCLTPRDGRIADSMCKPSKSLVALRTVSGSSEFMMLSALANGIDDCPILPTILDHDDGTRRKRKQLHPTPSITSSDNGWIVLVDTDGIDIESRLSDTVKRFTLNEDQAKVLYATAGSVIKHPRWNRNENAAPVLLVHGVFGSGKSYLAAVLIIFIQELVDDINAGREPEDRITYNILITSITNVAVDRILLSLLDLGYDDFARVGSLRKIAKAILPYSVQSRVNNDADIKELEAMLKDEPMSANDTSFVETALQKFQKAETQANIKEARVIGTTCVASVFELFNGTTVPLILLDEASQIMEPMAMVPITRFSAERIILIGDPLQLPPTLVTPCDPEIAGQGIEKTLFDRCAEMGISPVMLRTQYRCHPQISRLSNNLFYERRLINGITEHKRPALFSELPHVCFVNVNGTEKRRPGYQSYHNDSEIQVTVQALRSLLLLGISPVDIGVISLYKEQADKLDGCLKEMTNSSFGSVQISTVDAFQGAEKEVIILCTVRTNPSNFIDNPQRINVALSRAKR
ncbi:hypothetical protein NQZ79_g7850 [Umbelopsis isabellina]|nr:hypothetical protein NQZ79_g7850 [Umbelopsis isabellina]